MPTIGNEHHQSQPVPLSDVISIQRRFLRSVNLERDFYTDGPVDGYIPTESGLKAFERIALGVTQPAARAFTITGSYGTGKSAFALFASRALGASSDGKNSCRRILQEQARVADRLFDREEQGYWPVLITGNREPIGRALVQGLVRAFERAPYGGADQVLVALGKSCDSVLQSESPSAREVAYVFSEAAKEAALRGNRCRGLLVVIDELGKFLEYAASHPASSDMQVLQELAEYATRSKEAPLILVTILHQAFEDYAHRLGALQRSEWQKVQGRFIDIPFGDGPDVSLRLLGEAIQPSNDPLLLSASQKAVAVGIDTCRSLKLFPDRLSAGEFEQILRRTYPIHPLALLVMPHLFRRFGQNERSLFNFIAGDDPGGLQDFLRTHYLADGGDTALGLEHLYDYVLDTMGATVYSHTTAKLWSETEEALFRVRDRDPLHSRLIKVIGLLSILGEQTGILPRRDVLAFALANAGVTAEQVNRAITALETSTLITYRQFRQAYRLYEGSDIDIDARLKEARAHFAQGADPIKTADALGTNPPIVARRHSYETGTLRYFDVRYCRTRDLEREVLQGPKQGHGLLLLCLSADGREQEAARTQIVSLLPNHPHVIVGLNLETEALHEAAVAIETLRWVQNETPELRNDRVAAREVRERLLDAQNTFAAEWERLLRPRTAMGGGMWIYQGDEQQLASYRGLQELVSRACDRAYPSTPRLLNELINRRQLSSSAAAARRNLIQAMIERSDRFRLGIEGFPPEYSIYASVLYDTRIHGLVDGPLYGFQPPDPQRHAGLAAVWDAIDDFIFDETATDRSVSALTELLRQRPYGVADGVIPVLLCAVLQSNADEVAIYEDGGFVTELDAATFERMIKRPADFQLKGCCIEGERRTVLERFARGLLTEGEPATLVNVVKELFRQFRRLPEYTWKTRQLSPRGIALRDLFKHAREPERLLFTDLPVALGLRPLTSDHTEDEDEFFTSWNSSAREVLGAYGALLVRIEQRIATAFSTQDWQEVRTRAAALSSMVSEPKLRAFIVRAGDYQLQRPSWLESVAAGLVGKPPANWTDADEQRFESGLAKVVSAFHHAEVVVFEKQKVGGEEQLGMRVAVTLDSGAEMARVVLTPRAASSKVDELTANLLNTVERLLSTEPEDIRMAVVGRVMQAMIENQHD